MTREEAVERIKDHIEIHRYHERNAVKIFEALDMAIEALREWHQWPVVRCENCKYYKKSEVSDRMMCWRKDVDGQPVCYDFNPNDFCSYGRRRTDGR